MFYDDDPSLFISVSSKYNYLAVLRMFRSEI